MSPLLAFSTFSSSDVSEQAVTEDGQVYFRLGIKNHSPLSVALFLFLPLSLKSIKSLSPQLNQQHQRRALQFTGVEALRPPQDGVLFSATSLIQCCFHSLVSVTSAMDWQPSTVLQTPEVEYMFLFFFFYFTEDILMCAHCR